MRYALASAAIITIGFSAFLIPGITRSLLLEKGFQPILCFVAASVVMLGIYRTLLAYLSSWLMLGLGGLACVYFGSVLFLCIWTLSAPGAFPTEGHHLVQGVSSIAFMAMTGLQMTYYVAVPLGLGSAWALRAICGTGGHPPRSEPAKDERSESP
jgi:hypothetical protein